MQTRIYSIMAMPCPIFKESRLLKILLLAAFLQTLLLCFLRVSGQSKGEGTPNPADYAAIKPLSVGDTLPPIELHTTWPTPRKLLLPEGAAGKLTIFYFWHTTCTGCWGKFPLLDSLQRQFGDSIQIITITPEKEAYATAFLQRMPKVKHIRLPGIYKDTLLHKLFPFLFVSHVAWVQPDGRVAALTGPGYVQAGFIREALAGNTSGWQVKKDISFFDPGSALFSFNTRAGYNLEATGINYTAWSNYLPGVETGIFHLQKESLHRLTLVNNTLTQLFERVYRLPRFPHQWRIPDSLAGLFKKPAHMPGEEWLPENAWCLEIQWTPVKDNRQQKIDILQAIENKFGITGSVDTLPVPCWIIKGKDKPGGTLSLRSEVYRFNEASPIHLQSQTAPGSLCTTPLDAAHLQSWTAFEKWCALNGFAAEQGTCNIPVFSISSIL